MKNALEQDLVTNSGREPGTELLCSSASPAPFSRQSPLVAAQAPAQHLYSSSCLCSCPGLRGQALLPCPPVTGAEATNSSTKGRRKLPALADTGHSSVRRALCAPTAIQQTRPEIPHFISTEQLQLGRAGPPPAAEEILWKLLPFLNTRNALQWTVNHS